MLSNHYERKEIVCLQIVIFKIVLFIKADNNSTSRQICNILSRSKMKTFKDNRQMWLETSTGIHFVSQEKMIFSGHLIYNSVIVHLSISENREDFVFLQL